MKTRIRVPFALLVMAAALVAVPTASAPTARAADPADIDKAVADGIGWIADEQSSQGSIPGFSGDWATTALAAGGLNPGELRTAPENPSLRDYWHQQYSNSTYGDLPSGVGAGQLGKAVLIAHSAGIRPTMISADVNLAASLASIHDPKTGLFGSNSSPNAIGYALLAMRHLDFPDTVAEPIVSSLLESQHDDGGWAFFAGGGAAPGDTDMTGAVLSMLCTNGMQPGDKPVDRGLELLRNRMDEATGAILAPNPFVPDLNGTSHAWALIGINACDQDPEGAEWTTNEGKTPVDAALDLQVPSGEFQYTPESGPGHGSNLNATESIIRALTGNLFSADPPVPSDPATPQWRPAPKVEAGTTVPIALAIDNGDSDVRLCAARIPSQVKLTTAIEIARYQSEPSGCVDELVIEAGALSSLNGSSSNHENGGWIVSVSGSAEAKAGRQRIGFGDVVSLRFEQGSPAPDAGSHSPDGDNGSGREDNGDDSVHVEDNGDDSNRAGARAPVIRNPVGVRAVNRSRFATVGAIGCPAGAGQCRVAAPRRAFMVVRGRTGTRRVAMVRVSVRRAVAEGTWIALRVRIGRRALRVLRSGRATGRIPVRVANGNGARARNVPFRLGQTNPN